MTEKKRKAKKSKPEKGKTKEELDAWKNHFPIFLKCRECKGVKYMLFKTLGDPKSIFSICDGCGVIGHISEEGEKFPVVSKDRDTPGEDKAISYVR